eukprot:15073164-Heterocapsa_arctica.AAC.1
MTYKGALGSQNKMSWRFGKSELSMIRGPLVREYVTRMPVEGGVVHGCYTVPCTLTPDIAL